TIWQCLGNSVSRQWSLDPPIWSARPVQQPVQDCSSRMIRRRRSTPRLWTCSSPTSTYTWASACRRSKTRSAIGKRAREFSSHFADDELPVFPGIATFQTIKPIHRQPRHALELGHHDSRGNPNLACQPDYFECLESHSGEYFTECRRDQRFLSEVVCLAL